MYLLVWYFDESSHCLVNCYWKQQLQTEVKLNTKVLQLSDETKWKKSKIVVSKANVWLVPVILTSVNCSFIIVMQKRNIYVIKTFS